MWLSMVSMVWPTEYSFYSCSFGAASVILMSLLPSLNLSMNFFCIWDGNFSKSGLAFLKCSIKSASSMSGNATLISVVDEFDYLSFVGNYIKLFPFFTCFKLMLPAASVSKLRIICPSGLKMSLRSMEWTFVPFEFICVTVYPSVLMTAVIYTFSTSLLPFLEWTLLFLEDCDWFI